MAHCSLTWPLSSLCPIPLQRACEVYKVDPGMVAEKIGYKPAYSNDNYRIVPYRDSIGEKDICNDLKTVHKKDIYPATLKCRVKLQSPQSE